MYEVALSSSALMDCIITLKILFKILGTLTLQAFLNEFKNRLTSAFLQGGPFQNVQCLLAAHSTSHYPSSPVIRPGYRINFKILLLTFNALYGMAPIELILKFYYLLSTPSMAWHLVAYPAQISTRAA